MALVKPSYFSVDAAGFVFQDSMTTSDSISIQKITLAGSAGVAVDAGSNSIVNVLDPVNNLDVANRQWTNAQIQAALTGLSWKQAVKAATIAVLPDAYTYANGTLGVGATLTRVGNGAFPLIDGIAIVAGTVTTGDRVLIKNELTTSKPYNGIYVLTTQGSAGAAWVLTRALDNDTVSEMIQATVAIDQGTLQDTTWIQSTHPTTMGADDISWVAGPSITAYTASHGVKLVTSDFQVNPGDGIAVDATYVNVNLSTSNPGLALVGTSPAKTLEAKVDTARGINKDGSGIYLGLNATNPGLAFTSTYVDTKLDTTGGIQAVANGLALKLFGNTLQQNGTSGVSVSYAPETQTTRTASGGISKGAGVYYSAAGLISQGDSSNISKCGVIGVALAAITNGNPGQIAQNGSIVAGVLTAAAAGTPYYMGHAGVPVLASSLVTQDRAILLGYAATATDLEVRIQDMGKKP